MPVLGRLLVATPFLLLILAPRAVAGPPWTAVTVRFICAYEPTLQYLNLGPKLTQFRDGSHTRPVALLDEKQTLMVLETIQGDRRNQELLAPRLAVAAGQKAALTLAGLDDLVRGTVFDWDEAEAQAAVARPVRGVAGAHVSVQPLPSLEETTVVHLNARLIKTDGPTLALPGQPKESRFLADPVNATLPIPNRGGALLGAWKVRRSMDQELGMPLFGKMCRRFTGHERFEPETYVILIMVTPRAIIESEIGEAETFEVRPGAP